jgi:hypothetical protein
MPELGSNSTGAESLALTAAQPGLFRLVVVAGMLGSLLIVPTALAGMRLARRSLLTFIGGSMMVALAARAVDTVRCRSVDPVDHGGEGPDGRARDRRLSRC